MSTYTPIATQTLSTAAASVTFSSLPQNYTDLIIVVNAKFASGLTALCMQYNGDSNTTYSNTRLYGNDLNVATTDANSNVNYARFGFNSAGYFNTGIYQINGYSNPNIFKAGLGRSGILDYGGYVFSYLNTWRDTAPITSIKILSENGVNFVTDSTFTIYGIAAGNSSAKALGGNIVTTDGTYWYHTFTTSGTFTPNETLTVDYLVVAGGGGGGCGAAGGGGAGGYRTSIGGSTLSVLAQTYPVLIGAGGAGSNYSSGGAIQNGFKGVDSVFSTITSTGGGYGSGDGSNSTTAIGGPGGSGGGGNGNYDGSNPGGAGNTPSTSPSQGNNGGAGSSSSGLRHAGGGGGSGAGGGNASGGGSGAGGNGTANSISGTSVTYAGGGGGASVTSGGGGGAAGGTGGGGTGGWAIGATIQTVATAGTANTGGGGGGGARVDGSSTGRGAAGGSGIVIIRYAV